MALWPRNAMARLSPRRPWHGDVTGVTLRKDAVAGLTGAAIAEAVRRAENAICAQCTLRVFRECAGKPAPPEEE